MTTNSQVQKSGIREAGERCNDIEMGPLLHMSLSELDITITKSDSTESYINAAKREVEWMASSSVLTTMTIVLRFSFNVANLLAVGHIGANELGALTLALTCQAIFVLAPIMGLQSAMDTFCSTAFTASRDKTLVGFHFQRGLIAVCAHCALVAPILWNAEYLLLLIRQDPEIARLTGVYLRIHLLSVVPFAPFEATKRFLQAQGIMRAGTIVVVVVTPIHWINSYMLVRSSRFGMGFVAVDLVTALVLGLET
ncbi:ethionine resistance protein [Coemansia sp. RSA 2559]|nr:ethionine resistance protein [Coemansia sp. RSA 2559]